MMKETNKILNTNSEEMGIKAVELLFSKDREIKDITINSEPVFRQTCGCASELTHEQHLHSIKSLLVQDEEERFSTHLRHTEDLTQSSLSRLYIHLLPCHT